MKNKIVGISAITLLLLLTIISSAQISNINQEEPEIPTITGSNEGELYEDCEYFITSVDHQNDDIYYVVRCSDCPSIYVSDLSKSGETISYHHCWCDYYQTSNPFIIFAKAVDTKGYQSDWGTFEITIEQIEKQHSASDQMMFNSPLLRLLLNHQLFQRIMQSFHHIFIQ